ncbi:MAG: hypothetical protein IPK57_07800 [Chitinophagaceae bacterium]|nr:hypothetical protein [Chitinophagaceae bacterium]
MLTLGYDNEIVRFRMKQLLPVDMRLEMKKGINRCLVINDSYSADLSSLEIALNFLVQQSAGTQRTVILSDFLQSAVADEKLYAQVVENLHKHKVDRLIGIGGRISSSLRYLINRVDKRLAVELYPSTDIFLQQFRSSMFKEEAILVKGQGYLRLNKLFNCWNKRRIKLYWRSI